jgi:hypothetical protein
VHTERLLDRPDVVQHDLTELLHCHGLFRVLIEISWVEESLR